MTIPPYLRSLLFIPATRTELAHKGVAAGADALVFDLEDAVEEGQKSAARDALAQYLSAPERPSIPTFVRINELTTAASFLDLQAVVGTTITGVLVPKVEDTISVAVVDRTLSWLEELAGIEVGATVIVPVCETALGLRNCFDLAAASPRTEYMGGLGTRGGDVERSLGYRWSPAGDETHFVRAEALRDVRAAGKRNPVTGLWSDIRDLDGLRTFAERNRSLGYAGMMCIHPSHVSVINEVFTPSDDELDRDRRLLAAFDLAAQAGRGAVTFEGAMIDKAMAETARTRLRRHTTD